MAPAAPAPDIDIPAPRANPLLLGQEGAEATLLRAWRSGHMPHAWLLAGPRGIGKATFAYRVARFVLAEGAVPADQGGLFGGGARPPPDTLALDPDHGVFRRVAAGGHPDMFTLEPGMIHPDAKKPTEEIVTPHVRRVNEQVRLTPMEGAWRVAVVDGVERMNANAANAFLKLLEEPPARALILLVTHAPGRLLPTIRSRCRLLNMPPLSDAHVDQLLQRYRPGLSPEERGVLTRLSENSIGRALGLDERGGADLYREILTMLDRLPKLDMPSLHVFAERLARGGEDAAAGFRTTIELLTAWVARLVKQSATGAAAPGWDDETKLMLRLAPAGSESWLDAARRIAILGDATAGLNLDRKQALIAAFLEVEAAASRAAA